MLAPGEFLIYYIWEESLPMDHLPRRFMHTSPIPATGARTANWAKEANPLFSQRLNKAKYGGAFKP
jgi:hypothetical protein